MKKLMAKKGPQPLEDVIVPPDGIWAVFTDDNRFTLFNNHKTATEFRETIPGGQKMGIQFYPNGASWNKNHEGSWQIREPNFCGNAPPFDRFKTAREAVRYGKALVKVGVLGKAWVVPDDQWVQAHPRKVRPAKLTREKPPVHAEYHGFN